MGYSARNESIAVPSGAASVPPTGGASDMARSKSYWQRAGYAQLLKQFYALTVVCVSVASLIAAADTSQAIVLFSWSLLCGLAPFVLFANMPGDYFLQGVASLMSVYFWIAYPVKAIFSQLPMWSDLIQSYYLPPHLFADCLPPAIAFSVLSLLATAAALRILAALTAERATAVRTPNIRLLPLSVLFLGAARIS